MAAEDLSTYTEVDSAGQLAVSGTSTWAVYMDMDVDSYLYKNFGAGHFNGIKLRFALRLADLGVDDSDAAIGFCNVVNDANNWTGGYALIRITTKPSTNSGTLYIKIDGSESVSYISISTGTDYYFELYRVGDTVELRRYSDSSYTTVSETISKTGAGTSTYQYFYPLASFNQGYSGRSIYVTLDDFEFFPVSIPAGQVRIIGMAM